MKKSVLFASLIFVWIIFLSDKNIDGPGDFIKIPITKVKNYKQVENYLGKIAKDGYLGINNRDVKIFSYKEEKYLTGYSAVYFHNYTGKIRGFIGTIADKQIFQEAFYQWENDTMIMIKYTDKKNGNSKMIKLFGNYRIENNQETKISGIIQPD